LKGFSGGRIASERFSAHGWRVQIIVEVGVDPLVYRDGECQRLVRAPSVCPNCGRAQSLEAHGYYWRWVAGVCGLQVLIAVRRFECRHCPVTVSCLPQFAQPYRLVCNETIEAFFAEKKGRPDVERWRELLGNYRRRYEGFLPKRRAACGALFGRSPPQEQASGFWRRIMNACGGLAAATGRLVHALGITLFGRYRVHQRRDLSRFHTESKTR
jgi:ribosomal protein S27AE